MPDLSASANTIRLANGGRYWYRMYLSVVNADNRTTVLEGTVSATPASYPITTLSYTLDAGSEADALEDYEVEIFSSGGASKGRLRVAAGVNTTTTLQVAENGQSRINVVSGDTFKVYNEVRLREKLVAANADFDRDSRVTWTDQTDDPVPCINAGGIRVGFVDDTTGDATFTFSATGISAASTTMGTASPGTFTWSYDFKDGTPSSSTSAAPTVDFPAGYRLVELTGTDSANSKSYTKYIRVFAHERTGVNAPIDVQSVSLSGTVENGWEATIEFSQAVDRDTLPDGAEVVLWVEEWYGNSQTSYGSNVTGQSHIKFTGIVVSDESSIDAEQQNEMRLSVRAVSPLAFLQQMPGFSQVLENTSSPTDWLTYNGLTLNKAKWFLLLYNTSFARLYDYVVSATDYQYPLLYIQETNPYGQLKELVDAADAVLTCDRLGRVLDYDNPVIIASGNRTSLTTTMTLTDADIISLNATREHINTVTELRISGFSKSTTVAGAAALFARSSAAPGQGGQREQSDRKVFDSQTQMLNRCGWLFALKNKTFNNLPVSQGSITLSGNYSVFDFHPEWLGLTLASMYSAREITFSNARLRIESINETYTGDDGTSEVSLNFLEETTGLAGIVYTPPIIDGTGIPIIDPPTVIPYTPITVNPNANRIGGGDGINRLPLRIGALGEQTAAFNIGQLNSDFSITWGTDITTGLSGNGMRFRQNPYKYEQIYTLMSTGLYVLDDIDSDTSFASVATNATMWGDAARIGHDIQMSINRRGFIIAACGVNAVSVSFDYGATWTQTTVDGGAASYFTTAATASTALHLAVSPWNSATEGVIYAAQAQLLGFDIWKSTDYGLTWSSYINVAGGGIARSGIIVPYVWNGVQNRNGANQRILAIEGSDTNNSAIRVYQGTTLETALFPASSDVVRAANNWGYRGYHAFTYNGTRIMSAGYNNIDGTLNESMQSSTGLTTPMSLTAAQPNGINGGECMGEVNGFSYHSDWILIYAPGTTAKGTGSLTTAQALQYTPDFGASWYGNGPSGWTGNLVAHAEALLADFQ